MRSSRGHSSTSVPFLEGVVFYFLLFSNVQKRWMTLPTFLSPFICKSLLANTHKKLNCSTVNARTQKLIISGCALTAEWLQHPPAPRCRGVQASVGSREPPAVCPTLQARLLLPALLPSLHVCMLWSALRRGCGRRSGLVVRMEEGARAGCGMREAEREALLRAARAAWELRECCRESFQESHWNCSGVWFLDCCPNKYLLVWCDGDSRVKQLRSEERGEFSKHCPKLWRVVHCV